MAIVVLRGGGDLASGVALRLFRAGLRVLITELPQPMAVRRYVSFSEAVYQGQFEVEGVQAVLVPNLDQALACMAQRKLPVLVDPPAQVLGAVRGRRILVDGRMTKRPPELGLDAADLVIGLGPGFWAGKNCHAVVETNRGHNLGRVIWEGLPEADTGIPEQVARQGADRVLRAPVAGRLETRAGIGDHVEAGQIVAEVAGKEVKALFSGVLRGILPAGLRVAQGLKIGDIDPRDDPRYCWIVSDKARAVGGGVLEAVLTRAELRPQLWEFDAAG